MKTATDESPIYAFTRDELIRDFKSRKVHAQSYADTSPDSGQYWRGLVSGLEIAIEAISREWPTSRCKDRETR